MRNCCLHLRAPRATAGVYPAAVAAWANAGQDLRRRGAAVADARRIIVVVGP